MTQKPETPVEKWFPETQVLRLSGLSRSTLRSWAQAGLECAGGASYDLMALVTIVLLAECRHHLSPKEMVGAWRRLSDGGKDAEILKAAEDLQPGGRFDLVIDPKFVSLAVARSDAELAEAVRRPKGRAMVVLDVAEPVYEAVASFKWHANEGSQPAKKGPGRPRSSARGLRVVGSEEAV